jgi:hypothetical protein
MMTDKTVLVLADWRLVCDIARVFVCGEAFSPYKPLIFREQAASKNRGANRGTSFHLTGPRNRRMFWRKEQTPVENLMARLQSMGRFGKGTSRVAAVAAYEDSHTDARVQEFCRNLQRHLGEKCEVNKQMWLINELRLPQLRAIAASEAAAADLVIVAIHHAPSLPAEVREWIDLWAGLKRRHPIVVLGLLDPAYRGDSACLKSYLQQASGKGKVEFLAYAEEMADED